MAGQELIPRMQDHQGAIAMRASPRWYEVHEQQRLGRFLGGLSASVGAVGLGISLIGRMEKRGIVAAVGAALSGLGIWLLRKKYFRDPDALRAYLQKFKQLSVLSNLQEFGWENIFQVAPPELFVEKLSAEIGSERVGMDDVFLLYGVPNLEKMVSLSLLPREVLAHKLQIDLNNLGAPEQGRPLIKRLSDYGKFLVDAVQIDAELLSQTLIRDPATQLMSFEDLILAGARNLVTTSIVKVEFLHAKFIAQLRSGSWTWATIQSKFGPWILDDGIVVAEEVAQIFRSTFLTTPLTDIVTDFWPWPIQKYGLRLAIEPDEYQKMLELRQEWLTLVDSHKNLVETAKKAYAREEVLAGAKYGQTTAQAEAAAEQQKRALLATAVSDTTQSLAHQRKLSDIDASTKRLVSDAEQEMQSSLTKAINERDKAISTADSTLASDKARINKDWMQFIGKKLAATHVDAPLALSNLGGINITVNVGAGSAFNGAAVPTAPPL